MNAYTVDTVKIMALYGIYDFSKVCVCGCVLACISVDICMHDPM